MKYIFLLLTPLFFLSSCDQREIYTSDFNYINGKFRLDHDKEEAEDKAIVELVEVVKESQVELSGSTYYASKIKHFNFTTDASIDTFSTSFSFKHQITDGEINVNDINITSNEEPWRFDTPQETVTFYNESGFNICTNIFGLSNTAYAGISSNSGVSVQSKEVRTANGEGIFITITMSQGFELYGDYIETIDGENYYRSFSVFADNFEVGMLVDFEEF